MKQQVVAVDLDGTLAYYTRWRGHARIGRPLPFAKMVLSKLHDEGFRVVVFTTRAKEPVGRAAIWDWLHRHGMMRWVDEVTDRKPPAVQFFDDRASRVTTNDGRSLWSAVKTWLEAA